MPRKYRRQTRKVASVSPAVNAAAETAASASQSPDRRFNPDYSYVIKDLKRIGILAGVFFGILIVLSFIL